MEYASQVQQGRRVSVYNFLIPVFGALLSALFLGETILELKNLAALLFVSVGIYLVNRVRTVQSSNNTPMK